jgi:serine protease Do
MNPRRSKWLVLVAHLGLGAVVTATDLPNGIDDLAALESKVATVAARAMPATVALVTGSSTANPNGSGSGVVVSSDGLVLTAAHVIQGTADVRVVFPNGRETGGQVLGANYSKDIAMVRILEKGDWPHVELGESMPLKAADFLVALGHTSGFDASRPPPLRFGRVVSKGPGNYFTTDCTLIPGDSGGPILDLDGRLVGINSSIGRSLKVNNHAGIDGFRNEWDRLLLGDQWGRLELNPLANLEMPVLGIEMGRPVRGIDGVIVRSVLPWSPAGQAGIRRGDVIRSIDGDRVTKAAELLQLLAKRQPEQEVTIGLLRDDREIEVKATLKSRNEVFDPS